MAIFFFFQKNVTLIVEKGVIIKIVVVVVYIQSKFQEQIIFSEKCRNISSATTKKIFVYVFHFLGPKFIV